MPAAETVYGTVTETSDDADSRAIGMIGYLGGKRYVRAVATGTTGTDAVMIGLWFLTRAGAAPAAAAALNPATT